MIDFKSGGIPDYASLVHACVPALCRQIVAGTVFHRARMHDMTISEIPSDKQMGAPPAENAKAGRANSFGISALYVADRPETAVYEMRPPKAAVVHLARCVATIGLRVFDLTSKQRVRGLDPFAPDFEQTITAARTLAILDNEFAKPLAPHTVELDYLPTQVLAELIRNTGFDGIRYRSAMAENGVNYVFFEPGSFDVRYLRSVRITHTRVKFCDHRSGMEALLKQPIT